MGAGTGWTLLGSRSAYLGSAEQFVDRALDRYDHEHDVDKAPSSGLMDEHRDRLAVKALGASVGLRLTDERAAIVADAVEAWRPLLASLDELELADARAGPVFDASWEVRGVDTE